MNLGLDLAFINRIFVSLEYYNRDTKDLLYNRPISSISSQVRIPTLNKDFIVDEKQVIRARNAGATVILLIVAALPEARLKELYEFATHLGLEVLVETHNLTELEVAHRIGAQIIGVNNRNLVTFETDLHTSLELATSFEQEPVYISESAIFTAADARMLAPYFNGRPEPATGTGIEFDRRLPGNTAPGYSPSSGFRPRVHRT